MTITTLPTAPSRTQDADTFNTNADAWVAALPTFVTEVNALAAAMNAIAAGTAMSIPYTFSTTTTDADPGAGFLRLDNATQNTATTIRADLAGSDGSTFTDMLNTFDDSTSTIKGFIMLQKVSDATKWLLFSVSALASPSGYKNITVANVASSAASPFANNDSIILKFTRNGDKGDTGAAGGGGDHAVVVHTGNGHGSTNTAIRRFTTTATNTGTAITYADSAADGASFTINEAGMYEICYGRDSNSGAASDFGISLNSAQLTTSIASITFANRLAVVDSTAAGDTKKMCTRVVKLAASDVIRPHTDGSQNNASANVTFFSIRKVGTV